MNSVCLELTSFVFVRVETSASQAYSFPKGIGQCQSVSNITISMFGRTKRDGTRLRKKYRSTSISRSPKTERASYGVPTVSLLRGADHGYNRDKSPRNCSAELDF